MGYAGTNTEWEEDIPEDIVEGGQESIDAYIEETHQHTWQEACEKISVWAKVVE
jgi:hypothetical protein